jgi:uncharacterized protein (DUF1501 family)
MTAPTISRRRLLQGGLAAAGVNALVPAWFAQLAEAATPIGPLDGVLVLVVMGGGNDSLNMVVPAGDGAYQSVRGGLAIGADKVLPLGGNVGLHPNLKRLKARFDAGGVAVLQGIGDRTPDLSHFSATARWMGGVESDAPDSGWLGRWLDGLADDPLRAINLGTSVPLSLVGRTNQATALPARLDNALSETAKDDVDRRAATAVRQFGGFGVTGLGQWGDAIAGAAGDAVGLASGLTPLYKPAPEGTLAGKLDLAARLINADIGVRVLQVTYGDFDTHVDELGTHGNRMNELDAAVEKLFTTLAPRFTNRVTLLTMSEFGRRFQPNKSNGTDHGTAMSVLAVGPAVKGGLHGAMPSLTKLDRNGNLVATVDQRSVFASVVGTWLGGDPGEVLRAPVEPLDFLDRPHS